ncbi:LacI family DNA-binding transcriptional regulator [Bifidobacterium callitrichos]|nr:LacI family DNA-binding transcriptional regulator [Bifidobacterium callitrichos]
MVTLDDVAAKAGVSRMTASNALRGKSVVKASTAQRVLAAAAELGYRPNLAARQLSSGRTHIIGLSVADLDFIFPAALAADLSDEAARRGYQLITQQTRMSSDYERAMMNSASAQICDGTIVCWPSSDLDAMADFAATHPLVVLDGHGLEGRVDTVFTPNRDGARSAVTHLIEQGARRVLILGARYLPSEDLARIRDCDGTRVGNASLRLCGAWEAMSEYGGVPYESDDVYLCGWDRRSGYEMMRRILSERSPRDFDAVFALTDSIAIGALKALTEAGVHVPEDVMVIGFDGVTDGAYMNPGLTSVAIDTKEIATVCLDLLVDRIEGAHGGAHADAMGPYCADRRVPVSRTRTLSYRIVARGSAERR